MVPDHQRYRHLYQGGVRLVLSRELVAFRHHARAGSRADQRLAGRQPVHDHRVFARFSIRLHRGQGKAGQGVAQDLTAPEGATSDNSGVVLFVYPFFLSPLTFAR